MDFRYIDPSSLSEHARSVSHDSFVTWLGAVYDGFTAFMAQSQPISNGQFYFFLIAFCVFWIMTALRARSEGQFIMIDWLHFATCKIDELQLLRNLILLVGRAKTRQPFPQPRVRTPQTATCLTPF